jgi:hypothetical protein
MTDCHPQPFTHDFPHADIHELISCDLLHQVIKGTFKDHLVTWVGDYLEGRHGKSKAAKIMADIDRRYVSRTNPRLYSHLQQNFCRTFLPRAPAIQAG